MAIDIIQEVKNRLGNTSVPKIDPNTQEPIKEEQASHDVASATIPVVLFGFYKNTRNEHDANKLMEKSNEGSLKRLFREHTEDIINAVSNYSSTSADDARNTMEKTVAVVKDIVEQSIKSMNGTAIVNFFTDQRTNILKHLPAELHAGELINDPAMDDRTNKMEGPMSGMMHIIEKIFSSTK